MKPRRPLAIGSLVQNRLHVDRLLGAGGYGAVYLVHNMAVPEMRYALKVLELEETSPKVKARFVQEARIVASLNTPTVAGVRDYGHLEDGRPFLLFEFVDAPNLATVLERSGGVSPAVTVDVSRTVLDALVVVHAAGLLHRDIKPDNILVDLSAPPGQVAKLTDFGIAKVLDKYASPIGGGVKTDDGAVICTPAWAAPEVLLGHPVFQSDIFSLGLTMAAMVLGDHPFETSTMRSLIRLYVKPGEFDFDPRLRESPLFPVIRRALQKTATERYASAAEMGEDLLRCAHDVRAHTPSPRRESQSNEFASAVATSSDDGLTNTEPLTDVLFWNDSSVLGRDE